MRRGLGFKDDVPNGAALELAEKLGGALSERVGNGGIVRAAPPLMDNPDGASDAADVVVHLNVARDPHDACGQRDRLASNAVGDAGAIPALERVLQR
jgi:hypothetical protein